MAIPVWGAAPFMEKSPGKHQNSDLCLPEKKAVDTPHGTNVAWGNVCLCNLGHDYT